MQVDFRFEHNVVKANTTSPIGLMIECTAPLAVVQEPTTVRQSQGIVFVIDRSGSMGSGRLELVKQTILDLLGRLNRSDFLSVVSFDDAARIEVPMRRIDEHNMQQVRRTIGELRPGGSTNLELGYRQGIEQAALAGVETTIVLLSDGQANAGVVDPTQLGQLAARVTEHMIRTSTIGIGTGYDERILDALAVASNGNHFAAIELGEAVDGLTAEFDDLLNKTVANVKVKIELDDRFAGSGANVRKVQYLRDFKYVAGNAIALAGDMCSGEEKNLVFEVSLAGSAETNGEVKAATISVEWTDLATGAQHKTSRDFMVDVQSASAFVEPAHDEDVVAELRSLRIQEQKEMAIELMRQGRVDEAQALMAQLGAEYMHMLEDFRFMSERSRDRMQREMQETMSFSMMTGDEFIKRGYENVKRVRSNKPDPRKKGDN